MYYCFPLTYSKIQINKLYIYVKGYKLYGFTEDEIKNFHEKIAKNVKKIRQEKGLTQLDLALELGFTNSSFISHAENPNLTKHHYSIEHLYKISKVLDIDIKTFF